MLDLGLLELDEMDWWEPIRDETYQPRTNLMNPMGVATAYGEIPKWLRVSHKLRMMEGHAPPGAYMESRVDPNGNGSSNAPVGGVDAPPQPPPPAENAGPVTRRLGELFAELTSREGEQVVQ